MRKFITFLAVLSFMAAGCQSTSPAGGVLPGASSSQSYDPCELLQSSDFAAYYPGEDIQQTKHDTQANVVGQKICFYDIGDDMKFAQLSIVSDADMPEKTKAGGQNSEKIYAQGKDMLEDTQTVTGLGDEAYYGGSGLGLGKGLTVLVKNKGLHFNVVVGLGFGNDDQAKHLEIESSIAKKILERL